MLIQQQADALRTMLNAGDRLGAELEQLDRQLADEKRGAGMRETAALRKLAEIRGQRDRLMQLAAAELRKAGLNPAALLTPPAAVAVPAESTQQRLGQAMKELRQECEALVHGVTLLEHEEAGGAQSAGYLLLGAGLALGILMFLPLPSLPGLVYLAGLLAALGGAFWLTRRKEEERHG
jgi:hypothetical protein